MRPIDADRLSEAIRVDFYEHWIAQHGSDQIFLIDLVLEQIDDCPTIAPPPNDPLTLDELREMDSEPVWVIRPENKFEPCWMLVMVRHNFVMAN